MSHVNGTALPGGGTMVATAPKPPELATLGHVDIDRVARQRFLELISTANSLRRTMEGVAATPVALTQAEAGLEQIIEYATAALAALRKGSA